MIDLKEAFEKFGEEYGKFYRIKEKLHDRPDLCAFLYLDKLSPSPGSDLVCSAEHDQVWLDGNCEKLAEFMTEDDVLYLSRCGVYYDKETYSLSMFV